MNKGIESIVQELISKVEASQPLIDDLEAQVKQFQLELAELQLVVAEKDAELEQVLKERDLSMHHLQQVQEVLEDYFVLDRKKSNMLKCSEGLNQRMVELFSALLAMS